MSLRRSAKTKGYIKNIETNEMREFQFNPTDFTYTQGATFNEVSSPFSPYPLISYGAGISSTIPITLNMYGSPTINEIESFIRFVESFLPQKNTGAFVERIPKPKLMLFCYGSFIKRCVLTNFTYIHVRYNEDGVPIETVLSFNLLEVSTPAISPANYRPKRVIIKNPEWGIKPFDRYDKSTHPYLDTYVYEHPQVYYMTHLEDLAWGDWSKNGEMSGTTNQSRRLEAIKAHLVLDEDIDLTLKYQAHLQNSGWGAICTEDQICGTVGEWRRLEALKFWLEGEDAYKYNIFYRLHVENLSWMEWAKDGSPVGSAGFSLRGEAIEIKILPRLP